MKYKTEVMTTQVY